jgi:hypothetical protein
MLVDSLLKLSIFYLSFYRSVNEETWEQKEVPVVGVVFLMWITNLSFAVGFNTTQHKKFEFFVWSATGQMYGRSSLRHHHIIFIVNSTATRSETHTHTLSLVPSAMMIVVSILFSDRIQLLKVTFLHKLFFLFFWLHSYFNIWFKLRKRREFSFLLFEIVFGIQRDSICFCSLQMHTKWPNTLTHYISTFVL